MKTLVSFALPEEAGPFRKLAASRPEVEIVIVGIGRANAERSILAALDRGPARPGLVLTCGFAGGLDPALKVGDLVLEAGGVGGAPLARCQERLLAAGARPGRLFCADRVATTAAEKAALRQATGADAVEMESAAIQTVCAARGLPCLTLRVISDPAGEDLPLDFNALARPDQSLDYAKLAWAIVKAPGKIAALRELQKKTGLAARRLGDALGRAIFA